MTVSRALRSAPGVGGLLRARVLRVATDLGYRPDPLVSRLMTHLRQRRKPTLSAAIATLTTLPERAEPHQLRAAREGARRRAEELGFRLEGFLVRDPSQPDAALERTLLSRGIEGVLLLQMAVPASVDRLLHWERFATVAATPSVLSPDFPRVGVDYFHNARLTCAKLAEQGYGRIGFVGTRTFVLRTGDAFAAAAALQCATRGTRPIRPFLFNDEAELHEGFSRWLKREKPEALIVHADTLPVQLARHLGGDRFPIACTSVEPGKPALPGVDERHDLLGRKAVDVLTSLLSRNERNLRATGSSTLIQGSWLEHGTRR